MSRLAIAACLAVAVTGLPVVRTAPTPEIRHAALDLRFAADLATRGGEVPPSWTSSVLEAPFGFGLVGVRWQGSPKGDVQIRTDGGDGWTSWKAVEPLDAAPDPRTREDKGIASTEPLWVGHAIRAQVRWTGGEPAAGAELHVVDPGPDPSSGLREAGAAPARPGIVSRAGWGADESIRRCCPGYASTVKVAFVHHTVTTNDYSADQSDDIIRSIYAYHVRTNGWNDIGYNFIVDRFGRIFEGRAGGVDRPVIGAHAQGFNTGSTGVAFLGSFQGTTPPQAALDATASLIAWRLDVHHVDPAGHTQMTSGGSRKYPQGQVVSLPRVAGHRDTQDTACPGDALYSRLGWLRGRAHDIGAPKIFDPRASSPLFTPNGDGRNDTVRVTAGTTTGASWMVRVMDGAYRERRRWTGAGNVDVTWDGRDGSGNPLGHGEYRLRIDASSGSGAARPAHEPVGLYREPWGPWSPVGAIGEGRHPELATVRAGSVHVLARGPEGGIHLAEYSGGSWGAWRRLGGLNDQAHPGSTMGFAAGKDGTLHAVVRGNDSRLYHGRTSPSGGFSGWHRIGPLSAHGRDPVLATAADGGIHLLVVGGHDYLYDNVWRGGWRGWARVGGGHESGTEPELAAAADGTVLATVVGGNRGIYANALRGGRWSGWSRIGASHDRGVQPTLTSAGHANFAVAVRGLNGGIYLAGGRPGGWGSWSRVGNRNDDGTQPELTEAPGGILIVTVRGLSGTVYSNSRRPGASWGGWWSTGSSSAQGRAPASALSGGAVMIVVQRDGGPPLGTVGRPPFSPA